MADDIPDIPIDQDIAEDDRLIGELSSLFGTQTVEQARLIDVASLNLTDEITKVIADGVKQLKALRGNTDAQMNYINQLQPGTKLLLCLWIMDMKMLDNI